MSKTHTKPAAKKKTASKQANGAARSRTSAPPSAKNGRFGTVNGANPLRHLTIQRKVVVGPANDPLEKEADTVANNVATGGTPAPISPIGAGGLAQRQTEEPAQTQAEEPVQTQPEEPVQRQESEGEETTVQRMEEPVQTQADEPVQAQAEEEPIQRQQEEVQTQPKEEAVQRKGKAKPRITSSTKSTLRRPGAGTPIPSGVRRQIEPHVGANLSHVRVHAGMNAARAATNLNARAFTHRNHIFLNRSESSRDLRLMAHESTHVVQQGSAAVRRSPAGTFTPPNVQRLPGIIMNEINDYARHIPGYTLFTVIIGFNPLTGDAVERSAINLLEGLMGLVPFGTLIFDALRANNVLQPAFEWVEAELSRLDLSMGRIEQALEDAWEDVRLLEGFDYNLQVLRRHFGRLYDDVVAFARSLVNQIIELIKEAAIGIAEDLLAENKAWSLIKKIIKYDPLKDEAVEATTVEILEDFLLLIGKEQELAQMRERGTLEETAAWIDTQVGTFMSLLGELSSLISTAWDAIQPENLPNLADNLQTLVGQVGGFLQRVWDFAVTVAVKVLELIKKALLDWLSSFANDIPGYHLLTVILEKDVFTQTAVPRTPTNLIRGFMSLLPGGEQQFQQMQETGVIPNAALRIEALMSELGISWPFVRDLFLGIWDSLTIEDLIDPIDAFQRIATQFGEPISRLFTFVISVIKIVIELILQMMNFPLDIIQRIIANAMQAFEDIQRDPIGFLKNMLAAVKLGFTKFFDNILKHLLSGVTEWLFGQISKAGIEPPTEITLESILDLVLQILGISMDRIWEKLAQKIGQQNVDRIRGAIDKLVGIWNFVRDVQERGVAAIWEYIESQISNLWDMVMEQARNWIVTRIIEQVVVKLLSMLDPTGIMAVVNSFIAFFKAVQSAIEYFRAMLLIVDDYVSTVAAVARGDVEPGAVKLEQGLANSIPVAVGFLANQVGLGNLADKIAEIIAGVRAMVDKALDWLIEKAMSLGQSLLSTLGLGGAKGGPEEKQKGLAAIDQEEKAYLNNGKIKKAEAQTVASSVQSKHPVFKSISVVDGGNRWNYDYVFRMAEEGGLKDPEDPLTTAYWRGKVPVAIVDSVMPKDYWKDKKQRERREGRGKKRSLTDIAETIGRSLLAEVGRIEADAGQLKLYRAMTRADAEALMAWFRGGPYEMEVPAGGESERKRILREAAAEFITEKLRGQTGKAGAEALMAMDPQELSTLTPDLLKTIVEEAGLVIPLEKHLGDREQAESYGGALATITLKPGAHLVMHQPDYMALQPAGKVTMHMDQAAKAEGHGEGYKLGSESEGTRAGYIGVKSETRGPFSYSIGTGAPSRFLFQQLVASIDIEYREQ